jgi:hypothetical protein
VPKDAEQVAQVQLGVELVETSRGDEREQVTGGLGVVVGADEHPGVPADGDAAQFALRAVVCRLETAVIEVAHESGLIADAVAEGSAEKAALIFDAREFDLGPGEERLVWASPCKSRPILPSPTEASHTCCRQPTLLRQPTL